MNFRDYISKKILKKNDRILEFGPLNRPIILKKDYPNTYFADIRSTDDIKKMYIDNSYLKSTGISIDINTIVDVDYVISKSYKETFKDEEKFDAVILSHVIEHMPDIIFFFQDVVNILKGNGKLVIIYPDARYCFDHFRNGTSFIDAYDTYINKKPNRDAVFDFTYNVVHENSQLFFWNELNIVDRLPKNKFSSALSAYKRANDNNMPKDVHFWPFSDYQFIKFLYDMDRANLFKFEIKDFYNTQKDTQEFMLVLSLKKEKSINYDKYKRILSSINPTVRDNQMTKQISDLSQQVSNLKKINNNAIEKNDKLSEELRGVYNSKRWKLINKIINFKNRIFK